jgi:hypothetical protein
MLYLLAARLALRVAPFQCLTWYFARPPRQPAATYSERERLRKASAASTLYTTRKDQITDIEREEFRKGVQWVIDVAAWFLPCEMACFPRAIAAQTILRRFGISTTLYYGAATSPESGLTAHVWLQDGGEVIVGHHEAQDYQVLARYQETRGESHRRVVE